MPPKLTPEAAYRLARAIHEAGDEVDKRLEAIITSDPGWAYRYAFDVLNHPWPEVEVIIASSPGLAYMYALDVLKGPWPEAMIASVPGLAYLYAREVLKTSEDKVRFEEVQRWAARS